MRSFNQYKDTSIKVWLNPDIDFLYRSKKNKIQFLTNLSLFLYLFKCEIEVKTIPSFKKIIHMASLKAINDFLSKKDLAIAGVSRNTKKFGFMVFKELKKKGYNLYPINPNTDKIDNSICYKSVLDLPTSATNLYIVTPKINTEQIIKDAIAKGIKNIWIQQKSETAEALSIASENEVNLVYGECIIMFISPNESFHKFHRFIRTIFGKMPH